MRRCPCITAFGCDVFKRQECAARISDHCACWETAWIRAPGHFLFFLPFAFLNLSTHGKFLATCVFCPIVHARSSRDAVHFSPASSSRLNPGFLVYAGRLTYLVSLFVSTEDVLCGLFLLLSLILLFACERNLVKAQF